MALIRAAAKNHDAVTVVTDPADYERVLAEFEAGDGSVGPALRGGWPESLCDDRGL